MRYRIIMDCVIARVSRGQPTESWANKTTRDMVCYQMKFFERILSFEFHLAELLYSSSLSNVFIRVTR